MVPYQRRRPQTFPIWLNLKEMILGRMFKGFTSLLKLIKSEPSRVNKKLSPKQLPYIPVKHCSGGLSSNSSLPSCFHQRSRCWQRQATILGWGWRWWWWVKGGYTLRSFDVTFTHCRTSLKPAFYAIPLVATAGQMNFNATQTRCLVIFHPPNVLGVIEHSLPQRVPHQRSCCGCSTEGTWCPNHPL